MEKQYHGITLNDLYNALYKNFNHLVDEILSYESDTFSSGGSELTPAEAEKIAFAFILKDIERRANADTMDGGMITDALEEIRDEDCNGTGKHSSAQAIVQCATCKNDPLLN